MLPGVVLPQDKDVLFLGRFEKDTFCTVNLKGNRWVRFISFSNSFPPSLL